jgi:hypothetical protein
MPCPPAGLCTWAALLPRGGVGKALARHFLQRWESDDTLKALLRAAVTNEAAAARMQAIFAEQLGPAIAVLCDDSATAETRAGLIASQALGLGLCRYVLRLPPVVAMERDEVIGWLGPTFQRYITGNQK